MQRGGKLFFIQISVVFFIFICAHFSFAEFGPTQTRRDRLKTGGSTQRAYSEADYEKIHENFLKENYAEVDRLSSEYLRGGVDRVNRDDVLYLQALSLLKVGRQTEARAKLAQLEGSGASASIGDSYFYEGNLDAAYRSYEQTLAKYPHGDQTAYLLYKLFLLSGKAGGLRAEFYKKRLFEEFPESEEVSLIPLPRPIGQVSFEEKPFFTVQVGSFTGQKNAKALVNKLIFRRFDAYVEKDSAGGMLRVRVGRLETREEALFLETRLKKDGYPTKVYP